MSAATLVKTLSLVSPLLPRRVRCVVPRLLPSARFPAAQVRPSPSWAGSGSGVWCCRSVKVRSFSEGSGMGSDSGVRKRSAREERAVVDGMRKDQRPLHTAGLTLPTILTIARVAAVPLLVATFYMEAQWATTATTSIFLAAAVTDWLDGYLARKMSLGTAFGAFLDPVADKLMVAATLVLLCTKPIELHLLGPLSWLLPVPAILIIGREITMSAVREWAASQSGKVLQAVAVNNLGKWKTATQMTALTILLAARDQCLPGQSFLTLLGAALLYISAGLAMCSLVVYMRNVWRILLK